MSGNLQELAGDLESCRALVLTGRVSEWVLSRLVQLAAGDDGRIAIEALKLLVSRAEDAVQRGDSVLDSLPVEQLMEADRRAEQYIESVGGSDSADGAAKDSTGAGSEVLPALRYTDDAKLPGGNPPPADYGSPANGGSGDDHAAGDIDAPPTRQE